MSFVVTEAAMRPASDRRRCFYCHAPVGGEHDTTNCVLVQTEVVLAVRVGDDLRLEYVTAVPANWTDEDIRMHRNESSWCMSNVVNEATMGSGDESSERDAVLGKLEELELRMSCLCHPDAKVSVEFVRFQGEPFLKER